MTKTKKDKRTNNDLQSSTQKTKDRATRTPFRCSGRVSGSGSTSDTYHVTVKRHKVWASKTCLTPFHIYWSACIGSGKWVACICMLGLSMLAMFLRSLDYLSFLQCCRYTVSNDTQLRRWNVHHEWLSENT